MADNEMTLQMLHILLTKEILSDKWQKVIEDAIAVMKEREELIDDLKETVLELNQHIKDLSEYMTPYGKVKDVKSYAELMKDQEAIEPKAEKAMLDYQSWHYVCGDCGGQIDIQDNYCRHCGRVVANLSNRI